jgi:beta-galactosidase
MVPWKPGTLIAVARTNGKEVARREIQSAGPPARLGVSADQRYAEHPILTFSTSDADGHPYPYGENPIALAIDGPGRILSFENGNPADASPPVAPTRRAFMGKARLFLEGAPESLLVGSILGERRQLTSNSVSIDIRRIRPDGTELPKDFQIRYTVDGTQPTLAGTLYEAAFAAPPSCTVKAAAFRNGERLLSLSEAFGPALGLHWGESGEAVAPGASNALQAEAAKHGKAIVSKDGQGFHGSGFIDFKGAEDTIEFYQENDGPAGNATLVIRYTHNDKKTQRPLEIELNGRKLSKINFPPTGSWKTDWRTLEIPARLRPGANTLHLRTTGQSGPNLDEVEFR